jgi:hypothetical protein
MRSDSRRAAMAEVHRRLALRQNDQCTNCKSYLFDGYGTPFKKLVGHRWKYYCSKAIGASLSYYFSTAFALFWHLSFCSIKMSVNIFAFSTLYIYIYIYIFLYLQIFIPSY